MSSATVHIVSLVVWTAPGRLTMVFERMRRLPTVACHFEPGIDKLIVVIEADSDAEILDSIALINAWEGVANVQLVYQHAETAAALAEEFIHETVPA